MKGEMEPQMNADERRLSDIIIKKIQQSGAISFRDFMEMARLMNELLTGRKRIKEKHI